MNIPSLPNMNYAWSHLIVRELMRLGVTGFFVAPGSRSSPLAWTIAELAEHMMTVHFDERGLAFMALGYARATGKPAVIVTTSGTAVANLFPAVCEAAMDEVPLILLTADRPPELRDCGANQAMNQVQFFGSYARWFLDVPCPAKNISPQWLLATVDKAFACASTGPVHLNQMFREPLAPDPAKDGSSAWLKKAGDWWQHDRPYKFRRAPANKRPNAEEIIATLQRAKRGVVVAGSAASPEETKAMLSATEKLGWPLLPDIRSGLRLRPAHPNIIAMADQILLRDEPALKPDVVLHLGGRILSKRVMQWMRGGHVVHVSGSSMRIDPDHRVRERGICDLAMFASLINPSSHPASAWLARWTQRDAAVTNTWQGMVDAGVALTEPLVAAGVSRSLRKNDVLFLASSMPVRDMDMFGVGGHEQTVVVANRGVSGIDGTVSSAVGYAKGSGRPLKLIIGDLALLHDLNSLALVRSANVPVKIIVINNNGGGIFSFLPIAGVPRHFEACFGTPHWFTDFRNAAKQFELPYVRVDTTAALHKALAGRAVLIEVKSNRRENHTAHRTYQARLACASRKNR